MTLKTFSILSVPNTNFFLRYLFSIPDLGSSILDLDSSIPDLGSLYPVFQIESKGNLSAPEQLLLLKFTGRVEICTYIPKIRFKDLKMNIM